MSHVTRPPVSQGRCAPCYKAPVSHVTRPPCPMLQGAVSRYKACGPVLQGTSPSAITIAGLQMRIPEDTIWRSSASHKRSSSSATTLSSCTSAPRRCRSSKLLNHTVRHCLAYRSHCFTYQSRTIELAVPALLGIPVLALLDIPVPALFSTHFSTAYIPAHHCLKA